ncbi:unnamed protein product [Amoebophrya sp. A25]|nr:unnamed protein product [Amoebophrya sp. A25]|eukprot:GSA25T00001114001.1
MFFLPWTIRDAAKEAIFRQEPESSAVAEVGTTANCSLDATGVSPARLSFTSAAPKDTRSQRRTSRSRLHQRRYGQQPASNHQRQDRAKDSLLCCGTKVSTNKTTSKFATKMKTRIVRSGLQLVVTL